MYVDRSDSGHGMFVYRSAIREFIGQMEHSMYLRTSVSFAKHGNPCEREDMRREDPGEYFPGAACRVVFPTHFQRRSRGKKDVEKLWFRRQIRWDWRFVSSIDTELTEKQILDKTQFYATPVRRYIIIGR